MENNQQTHELATTVLAQIYADYQKEKKWARFYKYLYYGFFAIIFSLMVATIFGSKDKSAAAVHIKPYVAVMKFSGPIGEEEEINIEDYAPFIEDTFKDPNVVGLVLEMNSPGGGVYDTYMIYDKIQQMKLKYPEKKVTTYVTRLAASAGYWLSLSADKIYTTPVSYVGSIGVRTGTLFDLTEFAKEHKFKPESFQAGRFKTMGSPWQSWTDEERAIMQANLDEVYTMFVNLVQTRRGDKLDKDPDLFSGLVWRASSALKKGLIDHCDVSFDEMIKAEYGDYNYSYVEPKKTEFNLLEYIKELKDTIGASAKFLGIALDRKTIDKYELYAQ